MQNTVLKPDNMLDIEAIREDSDMLVIAEELGVNVVIRGTKKLILCPCHDDHKIGSCYIEDRGFFICYSCGRRGDVFAFVQAVCHVGFIESVRIVAEINGGAEVYFLEGEALEAQREKHRLIPPGDRKFIGLDSGPVFRMISPRDEDNEEMNDIPNVIDDYDMLQYYSELGYQIEELNGECWGSECESVMYGGDISAEFFPWLLNYYEGKNGCGQEPPVDENVPVFDWPLDENEDDMLFYGYALKMKIDPNPLYTFYKKDPESYEMLIDSRCANKILKLEEWIEAFKNPSAHPEYADIVQSLCQNAPKDEWIVTFSKMIERARRISFIYGAGGFSDFGEGCKGPEKIRRQPNAAVVMAANSMWNKETGAPF